MNKIILNLEKLKKINSLRYEFFAAFIFIIYSLNYYIGRGYSYYKDNWGIDQWFMENIARKIVEGDSLVGHLSHGISYPLLVAPFINIAANPQHITAFFVFTYFAASLFRNLDRAIQIKRKKIIIISFVVIALIFSPDMQFWILGGSNTLTALLILLSILWSISPIVPNSLPIVLGILSGLVFSARYVDYVLLIPLYFSAIFNYSKIYKKSLFKNLLKAFLISSIFIFFSLIVHRIVLGDFFATPYDTRVSDASRLAEVSLGESISDQLQNRYLSWIIPNLYSTYIDYSSFASQLTVKGAITAFQKCFILFFAPYSLVNFVLFYFRIPENKFKSRLKILIPSALTSVFVWIVFYASGWAYTAHDLLWHCLRYFMGWTTLLVFISLYGLILKPNRKTFFFSSFLYIFIIAYPTYFTKNEFKNIEILNKSEVYTSKFLNQKKEFNLPIPFDKGKRSLLFLNDKGLVVGNDNYTNTLFVGDCNFEKLNTDNFKNKYNSCKFLNTRTQYVPEDGMEFLDMEKLKNSYLLSYKVSENGITKFDKILVKKSSYKIEDKGSYKLLLDSSDKYKVVDNKSRTFFLKRNNDYYLDNSTNLYWPNWPIFAAEKIDNINQILTVNKKDQIYCIWELDKNWNFRKDRLCGAFGNAQMQVHEDEFQVDIDGDGYINNSFDNESELKLKEILQNKDNVMNKLIYKVNPIKMEVNKFRFNLKENYQIKKNIELNIVLTGTGNGNYKNFPEIISLNCGEENDACRANKIGRFNNLWRIWIEIKKPIKFIEIITEEVPKNKPDYWPIQYFYVKNP